jgi:outer membrane protein TolC
MPSFSFSPQVAPGGSSSLRRRCVAAMLFLASASLFSTPAAAAETPLSLAEALTLAVARSQQLVSQRATADAAHEMVVSAGELPDPKLRAGVENVPTQGQDAWSLTRDFMTMSKIGVMQEFPRGEKRRLKAQLAERNAERGAIVVEATTLAIRRDAASAWVARRFADDTERAVAAQLAEAELNATTVAAGYRAGKTPQSELIAVQSMIVELRNRATDAAAQSKRARIMLTRYVGGAAERPLGDIPDFARLPESLHLADVDAQPELRIARAQEAIAAADAALAREAKSPDWSAEVSYAFRGSPYSNMVSLMFSIDLPWSQGTRQDREYAAKLKEQDAARAMLEDTQRMRAAEVQSMLTEWESARTQAQRIEAELMPLVAQRSDAALAAYRGGTGSLSGVLDARRALLEAELALIAQRQAAARAWAWLIFVGPVMEGS